MQNAVYFLHMPEFEYYKIGFSNSPQKRHRHIQACNPHQVDLVFYMYHESATRIESGLHYHMSYYRIKNEWFDLDYEHTLECLLNTVRRTYKNHRDRSVYNDTYIDREWFLNIVDKQPDDWYCGPIFDYAERITRQVR